MTSELCRVLYFIYVHPIVLWGTCKAQWVGLLVYYVDTCWRNTTRLRRFDEAIVRFVDGNLNRHFFEVFYCVQAVGASASHEISHMRRRYSALLMVIIMQISYAERAENVQSYSSKTIAPYRIVLRRERLFKEVGGWLFPIPKRSGDINPIENVFNEAKEEFQTQAIRLNLTYESFEDLARRVKSTLYSRVRLLMASSKCLWRGLLLKLEWLVIYTKAIRLFAPDFAMGI